MSALLEARGLVKRYGEVTALEGIDLDLEPGTITGLLGPDGAGKTTTMRLLTGLLRPDAGEVRLDGTDVTGRRATGGRIGYMPQRFSLYGDLSVAENLRFYAELFGVRGSLRRERTASLLAFARLEAFERRRAAALSGGMKQKLALACTLIHSPSVLVLDEPTTGVDPVSRVEFWNILGRLRDEGTAILVSTPYMEEADRCGQVIVLRDGVVLAGDTPDGLRGAFPLEVLAVSTGAPGRAGRRLEGIEGVEGVVPFGSRLHVTVRPDAVTPEVLRAALEAEGIPVGGVVRTPPTLEDVFIRLASQT